MGCPDALHTHAGIHGVWDVFEMTAGEFCPLVLYRRMSTFNFNFNFSIPVPKRGKKSFSTSQPASTFPGRTKRQTKRLGLPPPPPPPTLSSRYCKTSAVVNI